MSITKLDDASLTDMNLDHYLNNQFAAQNIIMISVTTCLFIGLGLIYQKNSKVLSKKT